MKRILKLYITKECNLHCKYCYVDLTNRAPRFDVDAFLSREDLLLHDEIHFLGGEPLMAWDDICLIIRELRPRKSDIKYAIISNGLLMDAQKVAFIREFNINLSISVHKKGMTTLFDRLEVLSPLKDRLFFSFILEPDDIPYSFATIVRLVSRGFMHFKVTPEGYSVWDEQGVILLRHELTKLVLLKSRIPQLHFTGITKESIDHIDDSLWTCNSTIVDNDNQTWVCSRFKALKECLEMNHVEIHDRMKGFINLNEIHNRYFYSCPMACYLDLIERHSGDEYNIRIGLQNYVSLNEAFLRFSRQIEKINGRSSLLTENVDEMRINLTNRCNLRCQYCYVRHNDDTIDPEIAQDVISFYLSSPGRKKTISFFGGEPLMVFDLLRGLVGFSKNCAINYDKEVKFKIATNLLLSNDQIMHFLKENHFEIHVSCNGNDQINNIMRDNSTPMFLSKLRESGRVVDVGNMTALLAFSNNEVDQLFENVIYLYNLGFRIINLEMILGENYPWDNRGLSILKRELQKISVFGRVELLNKNTVATNPVVLNVFVDGRVGGDVSEFHGYPATFKYKKVFDRLIYNIFIDRII